MLPSVDIGHAREVAKGFRDNLGREVGGQTVALTRLQIGTSFDIPVGAAAGDLMLRPGLRFVMTDENGGLHEESGIDAGGRIDFGVDYKLDGNTSLGFEGFYSGIGWSERESYGAGVSLRMQF